jgi:predicted ATPase/DNA-binding winged helix-turn-helix (wHTH) protein
MVADAAGSQAGVSFGPFRLFAGKRLLEKNGIPIALGSRAMDVLIVLVERAGDVVSKQELTKRVWPSITVDESSLRVHVAMLRKALGEGHDGARYVSNVSGRGYCFVAPVSLAGETQRTISDPKKAPSGLSPEAPQSLPRPLGRMIGRDAAVEGISALLAAHRFVTLHGPGGIGKTTVAVAVAHAELVRFANAVAFVDLGALGDPALVPSAVAASLGVAVQSSDPLPTLLNFLRPRRMLLVLDNCEHVIDSMARLAESVFREASEVSLLTTSREALRVEGEHVYELPALATPPQQKMLVTEMRSYAAVNLFLERASASGHQLALNDAEAAIVAEICRKLDGNALAIELAAGRVGIHGLPVLAELLSGELRLRWQGRRTALPRHQTLNATLDWSHNLIPAAERTVLRRLSILAGAFPLYAAEAVATDSTLDKSAIVEGVEQLVAKSLVQADVDQTPPRYRLLDTMRTYARAKLVESGEESSVARRHACCFRDFLERTRQDRTQRSADTGSRIDRAYLLGNVLAALEWSFSDAGDRGLGVELVAAAAPFFIEISLLDKCRRWTEHALSVLDAGQRDTCVEMELQAALGHSLMLTTTNSAKACAALDRALDLALALDDPLNQFRILHRLHLYHRRTADVPRTLEIAQRMEAIAAGIGDPAGRAAAHILLAVSFHLNGNQRAAQSHLEASVREAGQGRPTNPGHFAFHRPPRIVFSRVLWQLGYPEQALTAAVQLAQTPVADDDPVTSCIALIWCASVFGWAGDWAMVAEQAERLIAHAEAHFLVPYRNVGLGLRAEVQIQRGRYDDGISLLRRAIGSLEAEHYQLYTPGFGASLATGLAGTGNLEEAQAVIDHMIASVASTGITFMLPELQRIKGEICLATGDAEQAQSLYRQAFTLAEEQAALSWQLRIAISLRRLAKSGKARDAAHRLLADTYGRFTEGLVTADLKAAKELLGNTVRARR